MTARALMFQGTGSDVGKSLIVAGLCRVARRQGINVAPFKPQNMSNNAAACPGGGEIGRAQALQARAAGLDPCVHFNPVLLKPETDRESQVIVHGSAHARLQAADYMTRREELLSAVMQSFEKLCTDHDLILVEGAGSASEINLRTRDIANMGFAVHAGVPVCLIGDIDRGGVIASLVGTKVVLDPQDAEMIVGFLINRFRGDPKLFDNGLTSIADKTGWRSFGVVPWLDTARKLPQEDAMVLERSMSQNNNGLLKIVTPMLSRIANFDDADPLRHEPNVDFAFIPPGQPIPRDADVILLLGTKSTIGDLAFLRSQGWDHDIIAHARAGGRVVGICGGYQILGKRVRDPHGYDGEPGVAEGLGLLDVETIMVREKSVQPVKGSCAIGDSSVDGYEIHNGETTGDDCTRPMLRFGGKPDGARSSDGRIEGCYLHGLFGADDYRRNWLERCRPGVGSHLQYDESVDRALDALADQLEAVLDIDALFDAARPPNWTSDKGMS